MTCGEGWGGCTVVGTIVGCRPRTTPMVYLIIPGIRVFWHQHTKLDTSPRDFLTQFPNRNKVVRTSKDHDFVERVTTDSFRIERVDTHCPLLTPFVICRFLGPSFFDLFLYVYFYFQNFRGYILSFGSPVYAQVLTGIRVSSEYFWDLKVETDWKVETRSFFTSDPVLTFFEPTRNTWGCVFVKDFRSSQTKTNPKKPLNNPPLAP